MTALYFGWLAFRNGHFVILGGRGGTGAWLGGGRPPPPLYLSLGLSQSRKFHACHRAQIPVRPGTAKSNPL